MSACNTTADVFAKAASDAMGGQLRAEGIDTLQVNLGYRCNLSCKHCHLNGGPANNKEMSGENAKAVLDALTHHRIQTLDLTGGAPELNPAFRELITSARKIHRHVMARSNLAIFFEPGQEGLAEFYAANSVEVIASLPYYTAPEVDRIRGEGVFGKCMEAMRELNSLGYGGGHPDRRLNLVYNPRGAFFAPDQDELQSEFKRELSARYGVTFDNLYTFTNMPIGRFLEFLRRSGQEAAYERKLREAFNPETLKGVMCRSLISVAPDGRLYDCDFNQAIPLNMAESAPGHIRDFDYDALASRPISVDQHCFGCTAGSGST